MEDEPGLAELKVRVDAYKWHLIAAADPETGWACTKCGAPIDKPGDGWLAADELRAQANRILDEEGPIKMIALCELIEDGVFELNNRLRVRLTEPEDTD
ncbi:MAG TPA: hypothetical protein VLF21_00115 [Candidatus Saccharimonadales bacterium]|nr:hypothetical protein [Candidatus Saccharimonadales bacterium]